jgi:hypothetical protein
LIHDFVLKLERKKKELSKNQSLQLNSQTRRDSIRLLIEEYFNTIRPEIMGDSDQDQDISDVDSAMQELLTICHKRGAVKKYQTLLSKVRKGLITIDFRLISTTNSKKDPQIDDKLDMLIIATLSKLIPSSALSYQQALLDLKIPHRYSWRGPATDLREALREVLDHLAPDKDVMAMQGYKQIEGTHGPTMKQKVRYVLKSRGVSGALSSPAENATEAIEAAVGSFIRSVYTRSSISTHTPTQKTEVIRIRDFVRIVLCELLEVNV